MSSEHEQVDNFFENYRKYLTEVDDIAYVVLNAHLDVERALDLFLGTVFYHPQYLQNCNLSFYQRVHIARAYSGLLDKRLEWSLMLALGQLRNAIAHGGTAKKRRERLIDLRSKMEGFGSEASQQQVRSADDSEAIVYAAMICSGFLATIEEQLWKLRHPGEHYPDE